MTLGCSLLDGLDHRHVPGEEAHVVELGITDAMRGPSGAVHGGLLASLVDCAAASAVAMQARRPVATSSCSLSYLSGARVGPLRAVAETLRVTQHQGVAQVTVHDCGMADRPVVTALVTVSLLGSPPTS